MRTLHPHKRYLCAGDVRSAGPDDDPAVGRNRLQGRTRSAARNLFRFCESGESSGTAAANVFFERACVRPSFETDGGYSGSKKLDGFRSSGLHAGRRVDFGGRADSGADWSGRSLPESGGAEAVSSAGFSVPAASPSLLHYGRRYLDNSYDDRDLCENRIAGHRCARTGRSVPRCAEYRGARNRTLTSKTGLRDRGAWNLTEEERWASMWKSLHCPNRGLPNTVAIFRVAAVFFGAGAVSVCRCAVGFRAFLVSRLPAAHRASAGVGCRRYAKRGI